MTKLGWVGNVRGLRSNSLKASCSSFLLGCAGVVAKFTIGIAAFISPALAQSNIVPDNTLGSEASRVIPNFNGTPNEVIGGGAQRGQNLFHSFREFNIGENRGAYFFVFDPSIQNIFARVTGSNRSEILGILGTRQVIDGDLFRSNANLFLMNPNGIIFGEGARLDIDGSFYGTTANGIQFGNRGNFSATNPQTPGVLTVNPSALFFDAVAKQGVINVNQSLLGVVPGKNLALVGGDISLNNSTLRAFGGRIELAAIGGTGTVEINQDGSFSLPENLTRANTSISNSLLDVAADNDGSITINADNLDISRSTIQAGIASGLGTVDSQAGDITINTAGSLQIAPQSFIRNWVFPNAIGKGGDIRINTDSMSFNGLGSGYISASTWGKGDAGSVVVKAKNDLALNGSTIFGIVETDAEGNAGNIDILTNNLVLTGGGQLSTSIIGKGNAGNVTINARDRISIENISPNGQSPSAIYSEIINSTSEGNGGIIKINTGSLFLKNGGQLRASNFGQGNAGNVFIEARENVSFDGISFNGQAYSGAYSLIGDKTQGNGGNINIRTNSLSVLNGARISTANFGKGNAGSINIEAQDRITLETKNQNNIPSAISSNVGEDAQGQAGDIKISTGFLEILSLGLLSASTSGFGNAGNITIDSRENTTLDRGIIASNVQPTAQGNGGNISISTGILQLNNGAQIQGWTFGKGNAGNVQIEAREKASFDGSIESNNFVFIGVYRIGRFSKDSSSGVFTSVASKAEGRGGNINISTESLQLSNNAILNASTFGQGDAGSININSRDRVSFTSGGTAYSTVQTGATGQGGDIKFSTNFLEMGLGDIQSSTLGNGNAGRITIDASDRIRLDGANSIQTLVKETGVGNGGDISISTGILEAVNSTSLNSFVTKLDAATLGKGNAGNITVDAREHITLNGADINTRVSQGGIGQGGNVKIFTIFKNLHNKCFT
ncbi:MAG: filamentous hemagglutinin N-terminal domain-containing protein [Richelia sp. RM2_1_2]|nr:filamentous hemagglutinin N-terminal domain-containing protein [Richelia sp. RM2_1_2]